MREGGGGTLEIRFPRSAPLDLPEKKGLTKKRGGGGRPSKHLIVRNNAARSTEDERPNQMRRGCKGLVGAGRGGSGPCGSEAGRERGRSRSRHSGGGRVGGGVGGRGRGRSRGRVGGWLAKKCAGRWSSNGRVNEGSRYPMKNKGSLGCSPNTARIKPQTLDRKPFTLGRDCNRGPERPEPRGGQPCRRVTVREWQPAQAARPRGRQASFKI